MIVLPSFIVVIASLATTQLPQAESGTFELSLAGAVLITETFTRTATSIEAEQRVSIGPRVTSKARLAGGVVTEIAVNVFQPADTVKPAMTEVVRFTADSLAIETTRRGAEVTERRAAPRGTVPFHWPFVVWMEEILRKAKAMGGASAIVSVMLLNPPQQVVGVPVTFKSPTDATMTLVLPGDTRHGIYVFKLDDHGRVLSGEMGSEIYDDDNAEVALLRSNRRVKLTR
ncbi:MAG: hypothetical protein M3O61_06640 [Gemmatimonadota bacterium]|nr:hypothetical protein [Gemmatimonadota bacterium]